MSLYYDAVSVLTAPSTGGSFKSRIYNSRSLKASPAQLYALIIEASKWDILLKEVIEAAGIIKLEPKVCMPALVLTASTTSSLQISNLLTDQVTPPAHSASRPPAGP